jgi:hypothetical protein
LIAEGLLELLKWIEDRGSGEETADRKSEVADLPSPALYCITSGYAE